jgi:RimK-like ATP-grasp domain
MILVLGDTEEPMVEDLLDELDRRNQDYCHLSSEQIPHDVSISVALPRQESGLRWADGTTLPWHKVKSIYHRLGFATFEEEDDYSEAEKTFAANEFMGALIPVLNNIKARVANRPLSSSTNASKPFQTSLVQEAGFSIPETLVTSDAEDAREFFDVHDGQVIYKSISYVRSIVKQMTLEDLDRLDTLRTCPVQLQQMVPGTDYRVHVMGNQVFAHKINATENDYRYDKQAEIVAFELDPETQNKCINVARRLNMEIAGVDLRLTPDGETYCFEVNPSPAFSWYEVRTGQPITSALCDLLMEPS